MNDEGKRYSTQETVRVSWQLVVGLKEYDCITFMLVSYRTVYRPNCDHSNCTIFDPFCSTATGTSENNFVMHFYGYGSCPSIVQAFNTPQYNTNPLFSSHYTYIMQACQCMSSLLLNGKKAIKSHEVVRIDKIFKFNCIQLFTLFHLLSRLHTLYILQCTTRHVNRMATESDQLIFQLFFFLCNRDFVVWNPVFN